MTKKQIASVVGVVAAAVGALGLGVNGQMTAGALVERVRAVEVREDNSQRMLESIERKVDRLIERGR